MGLVASHMWEEPEVKYKNTNKLVKQDYLIAGSGQRVNLGSPECLSIGIILHNILHALGLTIVLKSKLI